MIPLDSEMIDKSVDDITDYDQFEIGGLHVGVTDMTILPRRGMLIDITLLDEPNKERMYAALIIHEKATIKVLKSASELGSPK